MEKNNQKPGYHVSEIPKGTLGDSSKILEEVLELIDAEKQESKVMALVELSDLVGAIRAYLAKHASNISLRDLETMSAITKRAFDNGHRT
jgi:phosphoribosyl-ATP pyrophosphohydrolase